MVQGLLHQLVQRLMCCPYSPVPCLPFCRVLEQQEPAASSEQLLGLLGTLLSTHDTLLALNQRDLRRTLGLLGQLAAQVAIAWRSAGSGSPDELLAAHAAAPKEVLAVLTAPAGAAEGAAGAAPAPALPPEQAASIAGLLERQRGLLEELSDAADVLRFWGRRSEKAAAGAATAEGREGDVPPMLTQVGMGRAASSAVKAGCHDLRRYAASSQLPFFLLLVCLSPSPSIASPLQAQQLLWAASQAYEEEQAAADLRTRQLVCQRYKPADLPALQVGGRGVVARQNRLQPRPGVAQIAVCTSSPAAEAVYTSMQLLQAPKIICLLSPCAGARRRVFRRRAAPSAAEPHV